MIGEKFNDRMKADTGTLEPRRRRASRRVVGAALAERWAAEVNKSGSGFYPVLK
jgi:hypothetical protein